MDFFTSKDWLGREASSYAFKLDHILMVVIGLIIGIFLAFFLRKKSKKVIFITIVSLWAFGTAIVAFYYVSLYIICAIDPINYPFNIEKMLPFHSCLMFMYIFPLAVFVKNKYIKLAATNFVVVINMIMGFITLFVGCPPVGYSVLSLIGFQSTIFHIIIVIVPLIMVITNYYDLQKKNILYGLSAFGILGISMWIFDAITGCDYFYFYDGHTFPVFAFIYENVPRLVWTLIVTCCYIASACIIHFSIYGIKTLIHSKKQSNKDTTKNI